MERTSARIAYGTVAVVIGVMGWALQDTIHSLEDSSRWVDHTLEVLEEVATLEAAVSRAESAQRGFMLTAAAAFRTERDAAVAAAGRSQSILGKLTIDNEAQHALIEQLKPSMAVQLEATETGWGDVTGIYAITNLIRGNERQLLEVRRKSAEDAGRRAKLKLGAALALVLLVALPSYFAMARERAARRKAEQTVLDLAENLPGAVFQYRKFPDGRRRYEFMSGAAQRVRGVDRRLALDDPDSLTATIVEHDRPSLFAALAESERTFTLLDHDYRVRMPDGDLRWVRTTSSPRAQPDGSVLWSGLWTDVTDKVETRQALVQAKDAAEAADKAKSLFIATMSHEIRTPMNGVLGMLELLAMSDLDAEQRTALHVVRESGRALLRVIDDILDFSKIEAGKMDLRPEAANLAELVERVRTMFAGNASSKGLVLRSEFDPEIGASLMFDPQRVQQILNNLVSNAIKFTSRGEVVIVARRIADGDQRQTVSISVSDTGIGIAQEDCNHLFSPFVQAAAGKLQGGGTGLGLSICRRLAEMMGGRIALESRVGNGTRVTFEMSCPVADRSCLPMAGREAFEQPHRAPLARRAPAEGRVRVLVVDDHPINRIVMKKQVEVLGFEADTAENGRQALEHWRTGRFGIVLTDCNMPEMDGYALSGEIRAVERAQGLRQTPIIACTANALGGEAQKCLAAGMNDYLVKPVELVKLGEKLAQWSRIDAGAPVIDGAVLREACGADEAGQREFLTRFVEYSRPDVEALSADARPGNEARVGSLAHRLKGAARTVGAMRLALACEELESALAAGDAEMMAHALGALRREWDQVPGFLPA